jgi:hypothetical protein
MVNWAELLPPPPEHPPQSELGDSSPMSQSMHPDHAHPSDHAHSRFMDNRSPISPVSKISACSCPMPHDSMMHGLRGGHPCYSDTEYAGGGGGGIGVSRYPDLRPYSPKTLVAMRTQSPMTMGVGGAGGGGGMRGGMPPGGPPPPPGMRGVCLMCAQSSPHPYMEGMGGGMGGGIGGCPHHHNHPPPPASSNYYSDIDHYRPGACPGPTSLHGYRMPPLSDTEGHVPGGNLMRMYPGMPGGMGEGPLMDRACQSSLPSLANECIHSPGYRSCR